MLTLLNILTFFAGLGSFSEFIDGKIVNGILLLVACVLLYDVTTVLECNNETTLLKLPYNEYFNSDCEVPLDIIEPAEVQTEMKTPVPFGDN